MTKAENIRAEIEALMEIKPAKNNPAYTSGRTITPAGCVNHSIGVAQPSADIIYSQMDKSSATWGVHAILGDFHKGPGRIILAMPLNRRPWGCGAGSKGSYNNSHVQWEVCEPKGHTYAGGTMIGYDAAANAAYFSRMWALLVKFNVYAALVCGYGADAICDHAEAHKSGYGSNHSDLGHWLPKHGKSMNDLRAEVNAILDAHKRREEDFNVTKTELKTAISEAEAEKNPTYYSMDDVPDYWKEDAAALIKAGAILGDGKSPIGLTRSELKAAIINKRYTESLLTASKME